MDSDFLSTYRRMKELLFISFISITHSCIHVFLLGFLQDTAHLFVQMIFCA